MLEVIYQGVVSSGRLQLKLWYNKGLSVLFYFCQLETKTTFYTLPTAKILSGKNAQAWVLMVLYLKKINENQNIKMKKNPGRCLAGNF